MRAGLDSDPGIPQVDPARPSVLADSESPELSWKDWYAPVEDLAACLLERGLARGDRVLIIAETRVEWLLADLAIAAAGGISVAVYPTLPGPRIEEILDDAGARMAFVSHPALFEELMRAPGASLALHTCVLMPGPRVIDPDPAVMLARAGGWPAPGRSPATGTMGGPNGGAGVSVAAEGGAGDRLLTWQGAVEAGRAAPASLRSRCSEVIASLGPDDPATIIYTSGTAGRMRGALLTHGNLLASAVSSARVLEVTRDDVYLPFLPMSHVLERVVQLSMLWAGARLHYSEGLDRLEADFRRVRPTVVVGVPRLYEKIFRQAEETARRLSRRHFLMFRMAARAALRSGRRGPGRRPTGVTGWIWNALVYRKVRAALGGRIRILISGGAPLGLRELVFLNGAGLVLVEGYGLTETASVISVNSAKAWKLGSVGCPLPEIEVIIAGDGEILVRGPSVMRAYWRDEAATRETLVDGWLHTGDLGRLDASGFLFVNGRKKDLIVTSQGKNVAPSTVETLLQESALVAEAMVVGDRRPFLVALIFPDLERLRARADLRLARGPELKASLNAPSVRALVRAEIDRQCAGLAPHEMVRDFVLLPDPPTVENGGLTPTNKLRRTELERRYAAEISALYERPRG